jgi:ABC-type polysaccharide/polyol phosphate transport system ATPase subunit
MAKIILNHVSINIPIYEISSKRFFKLNNKSNGNVGGDKIVKNNNVNVKALIDISLEINNKDRIGLIGHNGAGKTTLLKLLCGIYQPDKGKLKIEGSVSNLMKPGDVFLEEATGYENIKRMLFYYKQDINKFNKLINEIAGFSELGAYLNFPIKTYSTGMLTRLSFSIATSFVPEITLIDEDFGTGDIEFKNKAQKRMNEYLDKSSIIILASHDRKLIEENCHKCVLLNKGRIEMFDNSEKVLSKYYE